MSKKTDLQKSLKEKIAAMKAAVGKSFSGEVTVPRSVFGLVVDVQNLSKRLSLVTTDDDLKLILEKASTFFGGFDVLGKGNAEDLCVALETLIPNLPEGQIRSVTEKILEEVSEHIGHVQMVSKPGWDESDNMWNYRVREPSEFDDGSFRTVSITEGVSSVMGKLSSSEDDTMVVQSLRFSKDVFQEVQSAKDWIAEHPDVTKSNDVTTSKGWTTDRIFRTTKSLGSIQVEKGLLQDGEDMDSFRDSLRTAIHELARTTGKLGPLDNDGWVPVWPEYIYDGSVVVENHRIDKFWNMTWKRTADGGFEFGDPREVDRKVSFVPIGKSDDDVQKMDVRIAGHYTVKKGKNDTEERFVIGGVLEPNDGVDGDLNPDSDGDIYSASDIRKAAHGWAMKGFEPGIHHLSTAKRKISVVESFIAPQDLTIEKTKFKKGTWIMAAKILDDELWNKVKKGELSAWSIEGLGVRTPVSV